MIKISLLMFLLVDASFSYPKINKDKELIEFPTDPDNEERLPKSNKFTNVIVVPNEALDKESYKVVKVHQPAANSLYYDNDLLEEYIVSQKYHGYNLLQLRVFMKFFSQNIPQVRPNCKCIIFGRCSKKTNCINQQAV